MPVGAQAPVPAPQPIRHVIPLRLVQPLPCAGDSSVAPCVELEHLQEAVRRGNTFWELAGVRFWI
ncbi:MAG: hypothetical protein KDD47_11690, partial [Acidobacteria bacterium]|nr:hypothetical protein [Acidobacteriota bacterium]